jgi:putative transcription factor
VVSGIFEEKRFLYAKISLDKMRCDLCGKEGNLYKTIVEGTELNVCKECSSFGRVLKPIKSEDLSKKDKIRRNLNNITEEIKEAEVMEFVRDNISQLVKNKREKLGLKQEELAKKIAVKESVIHNIESGHFKPSIEMAKRIGRFLHVNLIEEIKEQKIEKRKNIEDRELTLGDMINIKMRKKK